jgi:hypothetical protein
MSTAWHKSGLVMRIWGNYELLKVTVGGLFVPRAQISCFLQAQLFFFFLPSPAAKALLN